MQMPDKTLPIYSQERFEDDSTDDGRVFEQIVPMQFKTQGVMQEIQRL